MEKKALVGRFKRKTMKVVVILSTCMFMLIACKTDPIVVPIETKVTLVTAPTFSEDSAFQYIKAQVDFGPRVPNTEGHERTLAYLQNFFAKHADRVISQEAVLKAFDGTELNATNIIASFNPENSERILLCAHWDTRPFADQGTDDIYKPILGANDGASGVGVLMEVARLLQLNKVAIGVDIILFDAEDYGQPAFSEDNYVPDSYCLGSQYWAKNPHVENYTAEFGILLDMVGGPNASFSHEGTSIYYANNYLHKVWSLAHALGYNDYFSYLQTSPITDDHLYVNKIAKIPTIDIIQYDKTTESGFAWYWHTHDDNLESIDKKTLKAVGQTLIQTIFQEEGL
jgi:glutaminyl-peptide cyclotransferase